MIIIIHEFEVLITYFTILAWLHRDKTPKNITSFGLMPTHFIYSNSLIAFLLLQFLSYHAFIAFYKINFLSCIFSNKKLSLLMLPYFDYMFIMVVTTISCEINPHLVIIP